MNGYLNEIEYNHHIFIAIAEFLVSEKLNYIFHEPSESQKL